MTTFASDVFYGFPTQPMQPMLMYDSAGSPPQLLLLIQTRWLHFFGHMARMSDSQDTLRALHTSIRGLPIAQRLEAPVRTSTSHLATDPGSRPSQTLNRGLISAWQFA